MTLFIRAYEGRLYTCIYQHRLLIFALNCLIHCHIVTLNKNGTQILFSIADKLIYLPNDKAKDKRMNKAFMMYCCLSFQITCRLGNQCFRLLTTPRK